MVYYRIYLLVLSLRKVTPYSKGVAIVTVEMASLWYTIRIISK